MTSHTIATPVTTCADLRLSDREVLNGTEVATLLAVDPRTVVTSYQTKSGTRWRSELPLPSDAEG
jgi:hypothetical protein